jgi:glycosyltransferase involved in cell wall biosynthesis
VVVAPGDTKALAGAVRRYFGDSELRERLRAAAAPSVAEFSADRIFSRLEDVLRSVA